MHDGVTWKEYVDIRLSDIEKSAELNQRNYEIRQRNLEEKVEAQQRLISMGIGMIMVLEVALRFLIK